MMADSSMMVCPLSDKLTSERTPLCVLLTETKRASGDGARATAGRASKKCVEQTEVQASVANVRKASL